MIYESEEEEYGSTIFDLLQLLLLDVCENPICKKKTEFNRLKYENMHYLWPDFHAQDATVNMFLKTLKDAKNYALLADKMNLTVLEQ